MWARIPLRKFGRAVKEPALIAFSTTSSEAALPKAMLAIAPAEYGPMPGRAKSAFTSAGNWPACRSVMARAPANNRRARE